MEIYGPNTETGRLDYIINVPLPDEVAHIAILNNVLKELSVQEQDIPCSSINETRGYGGTLIKIIKYANKLAQQQSTEDDTPAEVHEHHFNKAMLFFKESVRYPID
ncbi:unnamed protein product [Adineta steineri]|uniref:Uncharacterized protein n=1 Tax=Adineta steineri TaxID=433720 RepID=A0A815LYM3_9BILA|nr:unnamed protein product [Adineta steineri]CAF1617384.1 unnamed protein product [Adineta steineri]